MVQDGKKGTFLNIFFFFGAKRKKANVMAKNVASSPGQSGTQAH